MWRFCYTLKTAKETKESDEVKIFNGTQENWNVHDIERAGK